MKAPEASRFSQADSTQIALTQNLARANPTTVPSLFENRVDHKWLSTKEVARFLSISENAVRIMVHRNQITAFKLGRRLRFRLPDIESLLTKKEFRVKSHC